jgi:hypothetical protein
MRIILLVLDGFPNNSITNEWTPCLWGLGQTGGWSSAGGICELPSCTYPSHATLLTGRLPKYHNVWSGLASHPRPGVVPGWAGQENVTLPTIWDLCLEKGLRCAAIIGDHKLFPILSAQNAHIIYPPSGGVPEGTPRDAFGYPTNEAVKPYLLSAVQDLSLSFVFIHLNETDTIGHVHGPESVEAKAAYTATDGIVKELVDALKNDWDNSILIILSDHGMEPLKNPIPINLRNEERLRGFSFDVVEEGGCAMVHPGPGENLEQLSSALLHVPGVISCTTISSDILIVGSEPGLLFGTEERKVGIGIHGGSGTSSTVNIVTGGHPTAMKLAKAVKDQRSHLANWAPTIASLLGLEIPEMDGRSLTT